MKRQRLLVLVLLMVLTLSACSKSNIDTDISSRDRINDSAEETVKPISNFNKQEILEKASKITEENADAYNKCGHDAVWMIKDDIMVFRGTGEVDPLTPSDREARGTLLLDLKYIVYEEGITSTGERFFSVDDGGPSFINAILFSDTVEIISESCFSGCTIDILDIPGTIKIINTRAFYDGELFSGAFKLEEGLECIKDGAFRSFYIHNEDIPKDLEIPSTVIEIDDFAFAGMNIQNVYIPDTVEILGSAFEGCGKLETIRLPSNMSEIPDGFLSTCLVLEEIEIPSTVKSIGAAAFRDCESLREVTIPANVTHVGYSAFSGNPNLQRIYIENKDLEYDKEVWLGKWGYNGGAHEMARNSIEADPKIIMVD